MMHDFLAQLFAHARGVWRHRWLALTAAWLFAIGGWMFVSTIPDQYRASARLYVDTNSVLRPLLRGLTVQPDLVQRVSLISRMLLSRPNLERVARMSDLDLGPSGEPERERLLDELAEGIRIEGDRANVSLYSISFEHRDPESARRVVQSLVSIFIEEALVSDQRANSSARDFLDQEIADYEARLQESERRLADFKRRYAGLLPGEGSGYYQSLESQQAALRDAELALREALWRRDELADQIDAEPFGGAEAEPETRRVAVADPRIEALRQRLDLLLLRYTERHPDVLELRRLIAEIRAQGGQWVEQPVASASVDADSLYGSLRVALSEADAEVAALRARVENTRQRLSDLEGKIDSIPGIEAELKQLTRNYTTIAAQHAALLERRESARLSTQVEKTAEGVKFRVIDPPFVPRKPSAPNRAALAGLVLVLAVAGGVAVALGMSLLRPVFDDRRILYRSLGLPVLGTVGLVRTPSERLRAQLLLVPFALVGGGLLLVFGLLVTGQAMLPSLG